MYCYFNFLICTYLLLLLVISMSNLLHVHDKEMYIVIVIIDIYNISQLL